MPAADLGQWLEGICRFWRREIEYGEIDVSAANVEGRALFLRPVLLVGRIPAYPHLTLDLSSDTALGASDEFPLVAIEVILPDSDTHPNDALHPDEVSAEQPEDVKADANQFREVWSAMSVLIKWSPTDEPWTMALDLVRRLGCECLSKNLYDVEARRLVVSARIGHPEEQYGIAEIDLDRVSICVDELGRQRTYPFGV